MVCKGYADDGSCKHFTKVRQMCPVIQAVRDMFGEMNACAPVAKSLNIPHIEETS